MPRFAPHRIQPLKPGSYRRLARLVRAYAGRLEAASEGAGPRQKMARTNALNALRAVAVSYWHRHHERNPAIERREELARRLREDANG